MRKRKISRNRNRRDALQYNCLEQRRLLAALVPSGYDQADGCPVTITAHFDVSTLDEVALPATPMDTVLISHSDAIPNFAASPTILLTAQHHNMKWSQISALKNVSATDVITIDPGVTIYYDATGVDVGTVGVGGTLAFVPRTPTNMTLNNLLVYKGGHLEIGTATAPATTELVFRDSPIDTVSDPEQWGQSLIVFGKVTIHGELLPNTFTEINSAIGNTIELTTPQWEWNVGDKLFIPDTSQPEIRTGREFLTYDQAEVVTIASVSADGMTITTLEPIKYSHDPPTGTSGDNVVDAPWGEQITLRVHVANLTRSVVIRSENPDGVRGHVLATDRAEVDIRYAEFRDLGRTTADDLNSTVFGVQTSYGEMYVSGGRPLDLYKRINREWSLEIHDGNLMIFDRFDRLQETVAIDFNNIVDLDSDGKPDIGTNQIARYSLHMHHLIGPENPSNTGYQFQLVGNAITNADSIAKSKWGITLHGSHYGLIAENVVHNLRGAGIVTEDGSETENEIRSNFIGRVESHGNRSVLDGSAFRDKGNQGDGIWMRGPNNLVQDNVVTNLSRFGFMQFARRRDNVMMQFFKKVPNNIYFPFVQNIPTQRGQVPSLYTDVDLKYNTPFLSFENNTAYSAYGAVRLYRSSTGQIGVPSVLNNTTAWHVHRGYMPRYSGYSIVDGWVQIGDPSMMSWVDGRKSYVVASQGMAMNNEYDALVEVRNLFIENMDVGVYHTGRKHGRELLVENSELNNLINVVVAYGAFAENYKLTTIRNVLFGNATNVISTDIRLVATGKKADPTTIVVENYNQEEGNNFFVKFDEDVLLDDIVATNSRIDGNVVMFQEDIELPPILETLLPTDPLIQKDEVKTVDRAGNSKRRDMSLLSR